MDNFVLIKTIDYWNYFDYNSN